MANHSDAYGTMTLVGDWTETMIDNLNIVSDIWNEWYYSISLDNHFGYGNGRHNVGFHATGRWCVETNLLRIGMWTKDMYAKDTAHIDDESKKHLRKAYKDLCDELLSKVNDYGNYTSYINVDLKEDEPGCQILREATYEIYLTQDDITGQHLSGDIDKFNLTAILIDETGYDYNSENLVELGFYDSIEEANEARGLDDEELEFDGELEFEDDTEDDDGFEHDNEHLLELLGIETKNKEGVINESCSGY